VLTKGKGGESAEKAQRAEARKTIEKLSKSEGDQLFLEEGD